MSFMMYELRKPPFDVSPKGFVFYSIYLTVGCYLSILIYSIISSILLYTTGLCSLSDVLGGANTGCAGIHKSLASWGYASGMS